MIDKNRLISEFKKLVAIDSPSFNEREMADYVIGVLSDLGIKAYEDNAGEIYGSNTGNIYAYIDGDIPAEPILLSAHLDNVEPSSNKKAIIHDDGKITSDGTTVLGADDLAGVAEIIEVIRTIKKKNLIHRPFEILFSIAEEEYIKGSKVFDYDKIKSKSAYVLDLSGKVGNTAIKAPTLISFEIIVNGRSSHAGFAPDNGINAIACMAEAITKIKQGKIDENTTLNIGTISGGTATNIVSDKCVVKGEIRSYNHNRALELLNNLKSEFKAICNKNSTELEFNYMVDLMAYETRIESKTVRRYEKVCNDLKINTNYVSTFGGSDNNSFAFNGIEGIVVACGMNNVHTCNEYTSVSELQNAANIVLKLLQCEV